MPEIQPTPISSQDNPRSNASIAGQTGALHVEGSDVNKAEPSELVSGDNGDGTVVPNKPDCDTPSSESAQMQLNGPI